MLNGFLQLKNKVFQFFKCLPPKKPLQSTGHFKMVTIYLISVADYIESSLIIITLLLIWGDKEAETAQLESNSGKRPKISLI